MMLCDSVFVTTDITPSGKNTLQSVELFRGNFNESNCIIILQDLLQQAS